VPASFLQLGSRHGKGFETSPLGYVAHHRVLCWLFHPGERMISHFPFLALPERGIVRVRFRDGVVVSFPTTRSLVQDTPMLAAIVLQKREEFLNFIWSDWEWVG